MGDRPGGEKRKQSQQQQSVQAKRQRDISQQQPQQQRQRLSQQHQRQQQIQAQRQQLQQYQQDQAARHQLYQRYQEAQAEAQAQAQVQALLQSQAHPQAAPAAQAAPATQAAQPQPQSHLFTTTRQRNSLHELLVELHHPEIIGTPIFHQLDPAQFSTGSEFRAVYLTSLRVMARELHRGLDDGRVRHSAQVRRVLEMIPAVLEAFGL